jgi:acyl phosphate:glycerol-3-phosphate acyltransferase
LAILHIVGFHRGGISPVEGKLMPIWIWPILALLFGYLCGSIPFGVVITRMMGAGDVRNIGSGNIGATNVLRTGRKGLAAATLFLDAAKGAVAVLLANLLDPSLGIIAGVGAFFGHLFPIWLRFKGGKGVATMLGITLALAWPIGLIFAATWTCTIALTRISSVGGIAAAAAAPISAAFTGDLSLAVGLAGLAVILILRHGENIKRLFDGTEPRIGQSQL